MQAGVSGKHSRMTPFIKPQQVSEVAEATRRTGLMADWPEEEARGLWGWRVPSAAHTHLLSPSRLRSASLTRNVPEAIAHTGTPRAERQPV